MKFILVFLLSVSAFAQGRTVDPYRFAVAGPAPTFVSEISSMRNFETDSINPSTTTTFGTSITQNDRLCIIINWADLSQNVGGVSDTKGNTWTKMKDQLNTSGANHNQSIWSANVGTAITSSDTISITWTSPGFTYRTWAVFRIANANTTTQPDQSAATNTFGIAVTCPASTTSANTCAIGVLDLGDNTHSYSGSAWTVSGSPLAWASASQNYYVYKNITSAGSQDPGGTLISLDNYAVCWVAFK